ncbi:MAG: hypothetical protein WDA53_06295, partial [Bacillota bacterium]
MDGIIKRFGLKIFASDGQTVLLDDKGILQTWQEGRADNVDEDSPLVLSVYLPPETRSIRSALLRFRRQPFRAYSTGAASGGAFTTPSTGGHRHRMFKWLGWNESEVVLLKETVGAGEHSHDSAGTHDHGGIAQSGGDPPHTHVIYPHGAHQHPAAGRHGHASTTEHYHNVTLPDHRHAVSDHAHAVNNHIHDMEYGIYTSTLPLNVTIKVNGADRTNVLGGPFSADQSSLKIANFLQVGQWNT